MEQFEPDIVGISVLSGSYRNAMSHAEFAKRNFNDVKTILGNDHAATYGKNILAGENGKYVDYICTADIGELVFCKFVEMIEGKSDPGVIPKLMYRKKDGSIHNHEKGNDELNPDPRLGLYVLDQIPLVDWGLIRGSDVDTYRHNYEEVYGDLVEDLDLPNRATAVTINRVRGCCRINDRCLYCGIADLDLRMSSPSRFWEEIILAKDTVDANIFYEACDSLDSFHRFHDWIGQLLAQKRRELQTRPDLDDIRFFVYSNALGIVNYDQLVEQYKELGVFMVNIGLDSGDDVMLGRLKGWGDSTKVNDAAIRRLGHANIKIYASFVLGAPGESEDSLQNTIEYSRKLIREGKLAAIEVQPLYPLFNAKAGTWLLDPEEARRGEEQMGFKIRDIGKLMKMKRIWGPAEDPDPELISRDWVDIFCDVNYERLIEARDEIGEYARDHDVHFGIAFG